MPVPQPTKDETHEEWMRRCVSFLRREDPEGDEKQDLAICFTKWRSSHESMNSDFQHILSTFKHQFGEVDGVIKFESFILKNKLDTSKNYHPSAQFYESFGWTKPLIQLIKSDKNAKFYLCRALTANMSMKGKDWSNYETMMQAAKSMNYRPINYMHDHSTWLPYPRTRVDFAKADDFSIETLIRVDNADKKLQMQLDHDKSIPEKDWINNVSVEVRGEPDGGYHFTGLAMIPSGRDLPGDPCTEIQPLIFNESLGASVCKIYDGKIVCGDCEVKGIEVNESMSVKDQNSSNMPVERKNVPEAEPPNLGPSKQGAFSEEEEESWGDSTFPDNCFMFVPEEARGPNGNKSMRKLPVKSPDGKWDLAHVRNALARLSQTQGIPADQKDRIKGTLENVLKKANPDYKGSEESLTEKKDGEPDAATGIKPNVATVMTPEGSDPRDKTSELRFQRELTETIKKLSSTTEALSKSEEQVNILKEARETLEHKQVEDRAKIKEAEGKIRTYENTVIEKNQTIKTKDEEIDRLNTTVGQLKQEALNARTEKNEMSVKLAEAVERANISDREKVIALHNEADAQSKTVEALNQAGTTAQKLTESTQSQIKLETKVNELNNQIALLKETMLTNEKNSTEKYNESMIEITHLKENIAEKDRIVERGEQVLKKARKIFEQHGIVAMNGKGEITSPV